MNIRYESLGSVAALATELVKKKEWINLKYGTGEGSNNKTRCLYSLNDRSSGSKRRRSSCHEEDNVRSDDLLHSEHELLYSDNTSTTTPPLNSTAVTTSADQNHSKSSMQQISPTTLTYCHMILRLPRLLHTIKSLNHLLPLLPIQSSQNDNPPVKAQVQPAITTVDRNITAKSAPSNDISTSLQSFSAPLQIPLQSTTSFLPNQGTNNFICLSDDDEDSDSDDPIYIPNTDTTTLTSPITPPPTLSISSHPSIAISSVNPSSNISHTHHSSTPISSLPNLARVVRVEGATLRDGFSIDDSNIITRLMFNEVVVIDQIEVLQPDAFEIDDLPVKRLHIQVNRDGNIIRGWASLTGRTKEDSHPLLEIMNNSSDSYEPFLTINSTSTITSAHAMDQASIITSSSQHSHDRESNTSNELKQLVVCPFCGLNLGSNMNANEKKHHLTDCMNE